MLGKTLNHRYLLEQVLSRAPSGTLYLATDEQSGELLALKVFSPAPGKTDEGLLRYRRAMNRLEGTEHPHLLLPLWTGESDGAFFQVLPYFPASSLGELLSGGALPLKEGVSLLRQGASALAGIHGAGISHLNLKPSNLLVSREDGTLHLVMTDPARAYLRGGELIPARVEDMHYFAPEQLPWGKPEPDHRSDLYALGMIAYQALTGALPFTATTGREMMRHHLLTPPPSPRKHNEEIPPVLERILLRLVAKDPALRFQKAEHLLSALERWNATEPTAPTVPTGSAEEYAASGETAAPNLNPAGSGLAGRESARERLRTALAGAASGKGSLVLLQGEPGAGRGALVADLRTAVEGARGLLLEAAPPGEEWCPPYALPLGLLQGLLSAWETLPDLQRRELLSRLHLAAGEQAEVLTELLPALAPLLPEEKGQAALPMGRDWMRTLGVLTGAFRAIGEPSHPLVLFLRELQWADADSLEWLGRLIQGIGETSLLVIATVMTGVEGSAGTPESGNLEEMLHPWLETLQSGEDVHWIEVPPLSMEQCNLQLQRLTGAQRISDLAPLAEWMHGRWGGLPLANALALRLLRAKGMLRPSSTDASGKSFATETGEYPATGRAAVDWPAVEKASWPDSLPGLVQHHLELLPEEVLLVLQAASIFPVGFSFANLAGLLEQYPLPLLLERLESAIAAGVLERTRTGFAFRHVSMQRILRRYSPPKHLEELHRVRGTQMEMGLEAEDDLPAGRGADGLAPPHPAKPDVNRSDETAFHFGRGGDPKRWSEYGFQALASAWGAHALRAVIAWSELLREPMRKDDRIADLMIAAGIAHSQLGFGERALALLDSALQLDLSTEARLEAISHAAWTHHMRAETREAMIRVEEGLALAGETLPANPVGTALARLTGRAMQQYETLRAGAGSETQPGFSPVEESVARLLELASHLLAPVQPQRAVLADEKIVRLAAGRQPSEHLVRGLVRLAEAEGPPESALFSQARTLLERNAFPHAEAEFYLALGRCYFRAGRYHKAAEALRDARFRTTGDVIGEGEALATTLVLERLREPLDAFRERIAALRNLAVYPTAAYLAEWRAALEQYAGALAGEIPLTRACAAMRDSAQALSEAGRAGEARQLLAWTGELAVVSGDLGELLETVRVEGLLPKLALDLGALLMQVLLGNAHFQQAAVSPGQREFHLREARSIIKSLQPRLEDYPVLAGEVARLEWVEIMVSGETPPDVSRGAEILAGLEMEGVWLGAALLRLTAARTLKSWGDPAWMSWGNKALEGFHAMGAHLYAQAARTLLELEAAPSQHPPAPAQPMAETKPALYQSAHHHDGGNGGNGLGGFAPLLERFGRGQPMEPEALGRFLLETFLAASDAEYGALLQPNGDGQLEIMARIPDPAPLGEPFNRSLANAVWTEGRARILDNFQPLPAEAHSGGYSGETHSQVCVPLTASGKPEGVVLVGSPSSRLVFGAGHKESLAALGREAAVAAAVNRALLEAGQTGEQARREIDAQSRLMDWMRHAADGVPGHGPSGSSDSSNGAGGGGGIADPGVPVVPELLANYFQNVAAGQGIDGALLCFLEPESRQLEFGAWQGVTPPVRSWDGLLPLPLGEGQARWALENRAPLDIHTPAGPSPGQEEQALLNALGASGGTWLPLQYRGEPFALLLVIHTDATASGGDSAGKAGMRELTEPLRIWAASVYHAWRVESLERKEAQLQSREQGLVQTTRFYKRFLPPGLGEGEEETARIVREGRETVLPVLAGEVPGLTDPLGLGKADLMQALRWYFGRVNQALALHGGTLHGIGHGSWFAHFSSAPDRVLWAIQTMYQMLLALREEASDKGEAMPPTGLGLHLGPVVSGALPAGDTLAPFSVGSGMRTASRLASMSIKLRCGILVSQALVDQLEEPEHFDLRHLGKLRPAPGESRLDVFELFSVREDRVLAPMRSLQGVWDEALKEYRLGRWNKAAGGFNRYIAKLPHDRPARYMLRQCRQRERS